MQKPSSVLFASSVSKIGIIYRVGFLQISRFIFFYLQYAPHTILSKFSMLSTMYSEKKHKLGVTFSCKK